MIQKLKNLALTSRFSTHQRELRKAVSGAFKYEKGLKKTRADIFQRRFAQVDAGYFPQIKKQNPIVSFFKSLIGK